MTECRDPEKVVREIKRKTRRKFSSTEKIRIVLGGLRGEETIAELCRRYQPHPNSGCGTKTGGRSHSDY
jgi:transposase